MKVLLHETRSMFLGCGLVLVSLLSASKCSLYVFFLKTDLFLKTQRTGCLTSKNKGEAIIPPVGFSFPHA